MHRLALALVAAATVAATAGAARQPPPAGNGLIAFSDDRNRWGGAVYAVRPDGRSRILLRTGWIYDARPSPDGRRILLQTRDRLLIADADGRNALDMGDLRDPEWSPDSSRIVDDTSATEILDARTGTRLRDLGEAQWPTWSPDGKQIAYLHYPDARLVVVRLAGGRPRSIVGTVATYDGRFAWSPDGTRIAYTGGGPVFVDGDATRRDLYVARIADDKVTRVATSEHGTSGTAWSPDGKTLVFSEQTPDDGAQLVLVGADGRNRRTLTHTEATRDTMAAWSPDGRWIAFARASKARKPRYDVFVVHPDGSGLRRITPLPTATETLGHLTWTRDGGAVVFSAMNTDHDRELYAMRPDGSGLRPLTANTVGDYDPAWSPDGTTLAFVRTVPSANVKPSDTDVFVMRANGTGVRRVGDNPERDLGPAWSPDGSRLALVRWDRARGVPTIATIRLDGTGLRTLSARNVADWSRPAWSPDGEEIAFATNDKSSNLYAIGADGSRLRRLRGVSAIVGNPVWSPDGSRLAVTERTGCPRACRYGTVYILPRAGGTARKVAGISGEVAWSPDGRSLVSAAGAVAVLDLGTGASHELAPPRRAQRPSWQPVCVRSGSPGDDRLSAVAGGLVCGRGGGDRLTGGPAHDRLFGGDGDDRIDSAGGSVDVVGCGAGRDTVVADHRDLVGEDCEQVTRH